ncbi:OadG family protein [Methanococcoides sp. SA1]|nr:OadG family protein [Methanococcoides sp. SA1]
MMTEIISKIIENNGHINTIAGILVVFIGLIMISVAISLFNKASHYFLNKNNVAESKPTDVEKTEKKQANVKEIPEDELVAIATAVEVYRKLHFEILQNEITFTYGTAQTPWKMIQRNRKSIAR